MIEALALKQNIFDALGFVTYPLRVIKNLHIIMFIDHQPCNGAIYNAHNHYHLLQALINTPLVNFYFIMSPMRITLSIVCCKAAI